MISCPRKQSEFITTGESFTSAIPSGFDIFNVSRRPAKLVSGATSANRSLSDFDASDAVRALAGSTVANVEALQVRQLRHQGNKEIVIEITGRFREGQKGDRLDFFAASPAEKRAAASGSGLPFFSAEQAFDGTPNVGSMSLQEGGKFAIRIVQPNAFYAVLGSHYIPPVVHLLMKPEADPKKKFRTVVKVGDGLPFRTLTYPTAKERSRKDATFYARTRTVPRSQYEIFIDSAYPTDTLETPPNFWGLRPPV